MMTEHPLRLNVPGLTFDAERHAYTLDGTPCASVTQVLEPMDDYSAVDADVLARAGQFGSAVHKMVELDALGTLDEAALDPTLAPMLKGWRNFVRQFRVRVKQSEQPVASRKYRVCGTGDLFVKMRGHRWLEYVDIKTSIELPHKSGPQSAAYCALYHETFDRAVAKRHALQLFTNGTFRLTELCDPRDLSVFLAHAVIHNYRENP